MASKELWKIIEREYDDTPFNTKWNLLTKLQNMKISNNYKNYSDIIKQFDEHRHHFLKADLSVTARQFKTFNQILKNGKIIPDYHYIK